MNWLETATILVTGFVGSAEFASSHSCTQDLCTRLPDDQLTFEKGLLKTYGRIMPIGITAATVLAITVAIPTTSAWLISAAVALGIALIVTIFGNVPINFRTGRIKQDTAPEEGFIAMRRRWDVFHITRGSLQLLGFILVTIGLAAVSSNFPHQKAHERHADRTTPERRELSP